MTGAHRSRRAARATLWLPGLAVALGAAAATAHGLYQVALAAAVPAGIAWLYPLITDGLALVAYSATNQLTGSAARYAWAVVITAAGLSGLAQARLPRLRGHPQRFPDPAVRHRGMARRRRRHRSSSAAPAGRPRPDRATHVNSHPLSRICPPSMRSDTRVRRDLVQPSNRPTPVIQESGYARASKSGNRVASKSTVHRPEARSASMSMTPARARAHAAALRHAERHGALPTVSVLAAAADVSRGTAATVLKPLREHPQPPTDAAPEQPQR